MFIFVPQAELSKVHSSVAGPVAPIPPTAPSPVSAPVPVSRKEPTPNAPEEPSLERKLASTDPAILSRFAEQEKVKVGNLGHHR